MTPHIGLTVALCTHNHADRLVRTLNDLCKLNMPNVAWELLVVDNDCTDATPHLLKEYKWPNLWRVRAVREENLGLSHARNRAIREAHGDYIVFIDDDETPDPDWLCAYQRLVRVHKPDAFGSRIRVMLEDARPTWLQDELLGFLGELNRFEQIVQLTERGDHFYGGNFGFRKSIVTQVGDFDGRLGRKGTLNRGGEETDFYRRLLAAGMSVWWTPEAVLYHRISGVKLTRSYFLDLHFQQGRVDGDRKRGTRSRVPPAYLWPQVYRAHARALNQRVKSGANFSLRLEMNAAYFVGYFAGWIAGTEGLVAKPLSART